jgi:hypothetical protein
VASFVRINSPDPLGRSNTSSLFSLPITATLFNYECHSDRPAPLVWGAGQGRETMTATIMPRKYTHMYFLGIPRLLAGAIVTVMPAPPVEGRPRASCVLDTVSSRTEFMLSIYTGLSQ